MNKIQKSQNLFALLFLVLVSSQFSFSQCTAIPLRLRNSNVNNTTCYANPVYANNNFKLDDSDFSRSNTNRYLDGSLAGITGASPGFTRYNFGMVSTDTLRICGNSSIQLQQQVAVVVVEAGSTLLLDNSSLGANAFVVNYGTVKFGTNMSINATAVFINASLSAVLDVQGHNLANNGLIVNYGYIKNIATFSQTQATSNVCMSNNSVLQTSSLTVSNSTAAGPFSTDNSGPGCVQYSAYSGSPKCLTADGAAGSNANISFCTAAALPTWNPVTHGGCTTANTGFGVGVTNGCTANKCNSPLPVTLLSFTATMTNEGVLLIWTTSSRWSSDYFIIERSTNGVHWSKVGIVQSNEDSKSFKQYNLTDYHPVAGISYYKLSEVEIKGNKLEYAVKEIQSDLEFTGFSIHPNPTTGTLHVKINGEPNIYQFEIFDLTGKSITKRKLSSGSNYLEDIFTSSGLYIAKLKVGPDYYTQKIVVQ